MIPKFFDVHTHLNMLDVEPHSKDATWREVGKRTIDGGVWLVNVGADLKSSKVASEQAHELGHGCWSTAGIHPTEFGGDFELIEELAKDEKVVAIGECGLEYFRIKDDSVKLKQKELFIKHIELALELGKPLMIHCRASVDNPMDAYQDTYDILKSYFDKVGERLRFNMHFFASNWDMADKFLSIGGYLSFPGVVTFTNQYDEVVKKIPLSRLLSETDAPFVTPVPYRGQRNEPAYIQYVARRLAELRPESEEQVLLALVQNALNFFDFLGNS